MSGLGINIPTLLAQIINWLILVTIISASIYFIGRDARKQGYSWIKILLWVILSIVTFPIGFGLYFLLRKSKANSQDAIER